MISQLVDINTPAIFVEIDRCFCSDIFLFEYHLPEKIKNLHVVTFIGSFLKIEGYKRNCWVWIELNDMLIAFLRDSGLPLHLDG